MFAGVNFPSPCTPLIPHFMDIPGSKNLSENRILSAKTLICFTKDVRCYLKETIFSGWKTGLAPPLSDALSLNVNNMFSPRASFQIASRDDRIQNILVKWKWSQSLLPRYIRRPQELWAIHKERSAMSAFSVRVYIWLRIYSVLALENTTHQRPCEPIKGHIWVRVYQEGWRIAVDPDDGCNLSSLCSHHAYLSIPWKPNSVASMTRRNGFKVCLWLVVSAGHILRLMPVVCSDTPDLRQNPSNDPEKGREKHSTLSRFTLPFQLESLKTVLRLFDKTWTN